MKLPRAGSTPVQDALLARRSFLTLAAIAVASPTAPALASIANLRDEQFGYTLSYPDDWVPAPKPVKTHLSESLLQSPIRGAFTIYKLTSGRMLRVKCSRYAKVTDLDYIPTIEIFLIRIQHVLWL